jgi:hypothetical protein
MNTRLFLALALLPSLAACQLRPRAYADEATTTRGTPVNINVLANDSDPRGRAITLLDATDSAKGSARVNPDGTIRYTPNIDAIGDDVFSYRIKNTRGRTDSAEVLVSIVEPMQVPRAAIPVAPSQPVRITPTTTSNSDLSIADPTLRAAPTAPPPSTQTPPTPPAPLPVASAAATIDAAAITIFTREDDKNAGETVQLTIRRGDETLAQRTLGAEAYPRQTDRTEEIEFRPPVPNTDAAKLTLEVRKINSLGAGESWIMQVDALGRLSDGRTVPLIPKSLPFRFGGGSSNSRSWSFQPIPAPTR